MEFGSGDDPRFLYYTESTVEDNRPWRVVKVDLKNGGKQVVFEDSDPTHYVDLSVTKDKKFLVISSNTKEDSEILVLERNAESEKKESVPKLVIMR